MITGSKQELPDTHHLDYTPRRPDAKLPLIDPATFWFLLSECSAMCWWSILPWHDCIHLQSNHCTTQIPKKLSDIEPLLQAGNGFAFGIEADYVLSLRILAAYHLMTIVPAFAFWMYWLSKHPGDWQNASVPLLTVLALITVFWIMTGKRVGIS